MERPAQPEDLGRLFIEQANAGDADALTDLYEEDAVLALADGTTAIGKAEIHEFYTRLLADRPTFTAAPQRPALCNGDWALTSTKFPGGATAEVAHRQPDGTWRWILDQPNVLGE
ncbi:YybH family protein [Diaminobutyricibacter sp. McL0608]|uniref:YybH family protein n=1 Tax=Leifsonia sp. McL0608 TaxID=3143537 RepID=UPI0031F309D2